MYNACYSDFPLFSLSRGGAVHTSGVSGDSGVCSRSSSRQGLSRCDSLISAVINDRESASGAPPSETAPRAHARSASWSHVCTAASVRSQVGPIRTRSPRTARRVQRKCRVPPQKPGDMTRTWCSAAEMVRPIASTVSQGNLPTAHSPESITASLPIKKKHGLKKEIEHSRRASPRRCRRRLRSRRR